MGCDIHLAIEVNDGDGWKAVMRKNRSFRADDTGEDANPEFIAHVDFGRNYSAFSILANVRNGYGFGGCDTGDGFVPISDPKGIPDDISPEAHAALSGEHSATWVTWEELRDYDWTRVTTKRGWIDAVVFEEWDRMKQWEPRPKEFCGGITGRNIEHVTEHEMRRKLEDCKKRHTDKKVAVEEFLRRHEHTYCNVSWQESYTEAAGQLWDRIFPLMLKLSREHKQVRMVMDFDS